MSGVMTMLGLLSPMFCASVLMQKASNRRAVIVQVRKSLGGDRIGIIFGEPVVENQRYLQAVFSELDWCDEGSEEAVFPGFVRQDEPVCARKAML